MGNAEKGFSIRRFCRSEDAFTLIELIVSMTVLGLIVSVLYGSLDVGLRSVDASREKGDVFQRIRITHEVIERGLKSAYLTPSSSDWTVFLGEEFFGDAGDRTTEGEEDRRIAFSGEDRIQQGYPSDRLTFNAFTDGLDGSRVVASVRVFISRPGEEGGGNLLLVRRPLCGPWPADTLRLASGVEGLDIRYLRVDEEGEAQWTDEWDSEIELPQAIELHIAWQEDEVKDLRISDLPLLFYLPERPVR